MKNLKSIFALVLFSISLSSCGGSISSENTSKVDSTDTETSANIETTSETYDNLIFDQKFSGYKTEPMDFFNSGWFTFNSKFSDNSLKIIEGSTHSMGSGVVRSSAFKPVANGLIKIQLQTSGFNNNKNISNFIGCKFQFTVAGIDSTDDQNVIDSKMFSHVINEEDVKNTYLSGMNAYDSTGETAITMYFELQGNFEKVLVTYNDKPEYVLDGKKNGVNLEIFSLSLYSK